MTSLWPFCLLFFALISWTNSFNLDLGSRVVHRGMPGSMFGYSVDMYKHNRETWLLVGAPLYHNPATSVNKGGGVFRCSPTEQRCLPIEFDRQGQFNTKLHRGDTYRLNGSEQMAVDSKELQWFGATVVASRTKDYVVACAPHYKYHYHKLVSTLTNTPGIEPVGRCILAKDGFSNFKEFKPCAQSLDSSQSAREQPKWGYHRLGYCMLGFSAALPKESDRVYMGAPGSWYWHGGVFSQNINVQSDYKRTETAPTSMDDIYVGYSMASGDFNGDGIDDVAAGVPRGSQLKGMVSLFDKLLGNIRNITGEQTGSYFGAALAVGDIDGDKRDDIIIGAPLFSNYEKSEKLQTGLFDVGRVYVFFQGPKRTFSKSASVTGDQQSARFGQSVAFVGDLNRDGFNDFVVGAPYAGVNRKGAVFVYHGMKDGMRDKHYQVIYAEEADSGLSTFGFSVSGGRDVDDNEYPDIFVGSHRSDRAVMFKARPIISVTGEIKIHPKVINIDDHNCELATPKPRGGLGEKVACASITYCLEFKGRGAPKRLDIRSVISLDTKKGDRSYFLASDRKKQLTLEQSYSLGDKNCQTWVIYVAKDLRDKLTPIVVEANYSLAESRPQGDSQLRPILDAYQPETIRGKMEILKDCGPDNVCIPDLKLSTKVKMCNSSTAASTSCSERDSFRIGSKELISLEVEVANEGEDAFEAHLYLTIPVGLDYSRFLRISQDFPVVCTAPKDFEHHDKTLPYTVDCELGNPLPKKKTLKLAFEMSPNNLDTSLGAISLNLTVNSTNPEDNSTLTDNEKDIVIPLQIDARLYLSGTSLPEQIRYDPPTEDRLPESEIKFESDIGPNVTHVYQVINDGSTELSKIELVVVWPSLTVQESDLLYLVEKPRLTGNIKCDPISINLRAIVPGSPRSVRHISRKQRNTEGADESSFRQFVNKVKKTGNKLEGYFGEGRLNVNCSTMKCLRISCTVGPLKAGETAEIVVESRLWLNSLYDESYYDATISSVAMAQILEVPYEVPGFVHTGLTAVVTTEVKPKESLVVARGIPWWLILIAVLAGVAFLILLILLLWKLGFFKRQRAPSTQASRSKPPEGDYYGYSYSNVAGGPGYGARM